MKIEIDSGMQQNLIKRFLSDEAGAITVDWVVITAATVGIAMAVLYNVGAGVNVATEAISCNMEKASHLPDAMPGLCGGGTIAPPGPGPSPVV